MDIVGLLGTVLNPLIGQAGEALKGVISGSGAETSVEATITWGLIKGLRTLRDKKKWKLPKDAQLYPLGIFIGTLVVAGSHLIAGTEGNVFMGGLTAWGVAILGQNGIKQGKELFKA